MTIRKCIPSLVFIGMLAICANRADAVGWDSDDFLIGGGPSFTNKIGVFDHDLTFKGYLDSNFVTVSGMDFDASGRLVAVAPAFVPEVRVYDSSGVAVGGFIRQDNALGGAYDLKVALDGTYVVGAQAIQGVNGARQFSPSGEFLQQYGSGDISAIAVVPGNRVWIGGTSPLVTIYDVSSGLEVGTVSFAEMHDAQSMFYSAQSQTVLIADEGAKAIFEVSLVGGLVRRFDAPLVGDVDGVVRGPDGDIFATTGAGQSVLRWRSDGTSLGSVAMPPAFGVAGIVWAGNVPEPRALLILLGAIGMTFRGRLKGT